jgi:hypothetical protein
MAHIPAYTGGALDAADIEEANRATTSESVGEKRKQPSSSTSSEAQLLGDAHLRARSPSHQDLALKAPQRQHDFVLREESLNRMQALFGGADDMSKVGRSQDENMALDIQVASQFPMPAGAHTNDCVVLPPDVMAYWVRHGDQKKLLYTCPEINGTGFGGIANIPPKQFAIVMKTYAKVAQDIKQTCEEKGQAPLMIVANSGREGAVREDGHYPVKSNSKMIWEKAHIADICAKSFGTEEAPCFPDSLDNLIHAYYQEIDRAASAHGADTPAFEAAKKQAHANATETMKTLQDKPLVLLGYSRDLAECAEVVDGRAYLFGREINGIVNDRAVENLNMTQNKKVDFRKMALVNSTVDEGVNKFAAALARAEFSNSDEARALPKIAEERGFKYDVMGLDKAFHYTSQEEKGNLDGLSELERFAHFSTFFRGVQASEGLEGVAKAYDDFIALGHDIRPLFKPNGTGQSKGIIGVRAGESKQAFLQRFQENIEQLEKNFGKGAGYPFQVVPLLELAKTAEGENYDLRFAVFQNPNTPFIQGGRVQIKPSIQTIPLILKKEPKPETPHSGPLEFSPTNVTAAVAKTGRAAEEFVVPLCSGDGKQQSGLDDNQMKSMSLYFSAFQSFLLAKHYQRENGAAKE